VAVNLAITPDQHWAVATADLARAAAAAGFTGLGIAADKIDADAIAAYAETGLRCPEILALLFTDDVQTTVASAEHLAVQAEAIGAAWVLTVSPVR
jgi:sugar phosphate isomerase/epimerase